MRDTWGGDRQKVEIQMRTKMCVCGKTYVCVRKEMVIDGE